MYHAAPNFDEVLGQVERDLGIQKPLVTPALALSVIMTQALLRMLGMLNFGLIAHRDYVMHFTILFDLIFFL